MSAGDDELVLGAVVRAIDAARDAVPWYAGDFAPIRTDQVGELLSAFDCEVRAFRFTSVGVPAMAPPPILGLPQPIFMDLGAARTDRQFSIRHELAHVIRGETQDPTGRPVFLSEREPDSSHERVADLFALADLIPGWSIRMMRRAHTSWRGILSEIRGAILVNYATAWPDDRVEDRAALRLRLFRECGM